MTVYDERNLSGDNDNAQMRDKVWNMIKDIRICTMVTQCHDGQMCARPMAARQDDFKGTLWFFTKAGSKKVQQIQSNEHVLLAYAEPNSQEYVNLSGTADIIHDRNRIHALWTETMRAWFPDGPDTPEIALIRVIPESAEYWDAASGLFVQAFGFVRALMGGRSLGESMPRYLGEHASFRLQ